MYFASGESLYAGAVLLLLAIARSPLLRRAWHRPLRNIAAWLGLMLMLMACPPFPWIVDIGFLGAFLLWFGTEHRIARVSVHARWRTATAPILAGLLLVLSATELRHRYPPTITGARSDHLGVIGDSSSAGIDPRVQSWPIVMQQMTGVPVEKLALPGAGSLEALTTVAKLTPEDRIVLIEIGGNDLLSGVPSREFARRLGQFLEA